MKILIEIVHPAHVHFFRNPIRLLEQAGHEVLVTSRQKDCTLDLLDEFKLSHDCLTVQNRGTVLSMAGELLNRNRKLSRFARTHKPDVIAAVGGASAAQVGRWLGIPTVVFYNTEEAWLQNGLAYPFAHQVVVSESYSGWTPRAKTRRYRGYHELSYLHPRYFQPDRSTAIANGLAEVGGTFLIRLVSWQANHDIGLKGWDPKTLRGVLEYLQPRGRVLISSEAELPGEFAEFGYSGMKSAIHHVMAHCRLIVGESATMASEAVATGVPAIYATSSYRGYITEQQNRYGMAAHVSEPSVETITARIKKFLDLPNNEIQRRHNRLIRECVDVPQFVASTLIDSAT